MRADSTSMLLTVEGVSVTLKSAIPVQPEVEQSRLDMLTESASVSQYKPDCRMAFSPAPLMPTLPEITCVHVRPRVW